jgi:hypothetical protein
MNTTTCDVLTAARAEALFVSAVSTTERPSRADVEAAIRHSLRTRGGTRGCAADVAAAYGDYPELAAPRMRWALGVVERLYHQPPVSLAVRARRPARGPRVFATAA